MDTNDMKVAGPSFLSLLTLLFIGLKLTNYINWSWWWVLAPTWIPLAILFAILIIGGLIALIIAAKS